MAFKPQHHIYRAPGPHTQQIIGGNGFRIWSYPVQRSYHQAIAFLASR
ncbi:hypothetical protein AVEN_152787-1, partial [Araneus ventricosus]